MGLILKSLNYIFPLGRFVKLTSDGINITNSTNPVTLGKNITLTIIDCCAPPPIRLAAHCIAGGFTIAGAFMLPNPLTVGSAIHIVTEIYDNC